MKPNNPNLQSLALVVVTAAGIFSASAAQFTAGNLAVVHVGDGSVALGTFGTQVVIEEYFPWGELANSHPLPTDGPSAFIMSANTGAGGALSRSPSGSVLTLAGYNVALPFDSSPASASSDTVPRAVGTMDAFGNFSIRATTTTAFSGVSFRSAVTDDADNYWGIGNGGGTYYFGNTVSASTIAASPVHCRVMNVVNGNLYLTSSGLYGYSGTPTSEATNSAVFLTAGTGTGNASPYDFVVNTGLALAYVADDRATANGGGIQRWDFNGSAWSLTYTLNLGGTGARGLAVDFSGQDPVIYATTTESSNNRLVKIVDTGAASTSVDLASAGVNKAFRGMEFAPIPPISIAIVRLVSTVGTFCA